MRQLGADLLDKQKQKKNLLFEDFVDFIWLILSSADISDFFLNKISLLSIEKDVKLIK